MIHYPTLQQNRALKDALMDILCFYELNLHLNSRYKVLQIVESVSDGDKVR